MTTAELERIVRDLVPPRGATSVQVVVSAEPGSRLSNGAPSGIGVTVRYGVAWQRDGREVVRPSIAEFDRAADAFRLYHLVAGDVPTSRARSVQGSRVELEAPERCLACGVDLPPRRRGQTWLTCSDRCRRAAARGRRAANPTDEDTGSRVTPSSPSRPSTAVADG